jgi:hypothetical protein
LHGVQGFGGCGGEEGGVAVEDGRAVVERVVEGGEAEDEAVEVAVAWLVFVLLWWEGRGWRGKGQVTSLRW